MFLYFFVVMDDLTSFITAVLPDCRLQPLMDELESLGVNTVEQGFSNFLGPGTP